jgi:arabinan endo-1,5-alpha-L-arabinosidase
MWKEPGAHRSILATFLLIALLLMTGIIPVAAQTTGPLAPPEAMPATSGGVYQNPILAAIPGDGAVESCADPSIIHSQTAGDPYWYVFCTMDPLNAADKNAGGNFNFHLIPVLRSLDLSSWTYMGDAFSAKPAWVDPGAGLWAPDIHFFNGQYYLYYTASETSLPGGGSAIGVATALSPLGPWIDSGSPVVEPHEAPCCAGSRRWVFDPALITDDSGQTWIFYGSYFGGISARKLSADGLHSDPASQVQITIANKYEGAFVVKRNGYYYLFASATNCCNGPLTGYSVFVGRSQSVTGPYVDREGASFLAGRTGGTPALSMNGNEFVGTGHNAVFTDFAGQDWTVYHAVDQTNPYFDTGFTKRPLMMDPLDWIDGWPQVRAGYWASDRPMPAPAAQPGEKRAYRPTPLAPPLVVGPQLSGYSDEFNGALGGQWSWVRQPDAATYGFAGGAFRFDTQAADLYVDSNNASVLVENAPSGNYVVETKLRMDVPPEGCCYNYVQGGLVIYGNDDNFVKLADVSIWETRQTEFAKELAPVPAGYPRYGNTIVGPPGDWTWLRIVVSRTGQGESYRAYTSADGQTWERGGVWNHALGANAKIGLVSMGGSGFESQFDYVRVYRINNQDTNK